VGSLQSIAQVANDLAECNFAQLVSRENGSTIVATFVWTDFIATVYASHMLWNTRMFLKEVFNKSNMALAGGLVLATC